MPSIFDLQWININSDYMPAPVIPNNLLLSRDQKSF